MVHEIIDGTKRMMQPVPIKKAGQAKALKGVVKNDSARPGVSKLFLDFYKMTLVRSKIQELNKLFFEIQDSSDFDFDNAANFFNKNLKDIDISKEDDDIFGDILSDLDSFFNTDIRLVDPGYYNFEFLKKEIRSLL